MKYYIHHDYKFYGLPFQIYGITNIIQKDVYQKEINKVNFTRLNLYYYSEDLINLIEDKLGIY